MIYCILTEKPHNVVQLALSADGWCLQEIHPYNYGLSVNSTIKSALPGVLFNHNAPPFHCNQLSDQRLAIALLCTLYVFSPAVCMSSSSLTASLKMSHIFTFLSPSNWFPANWCSSEAGSMVRPMHVVYCCYLEQAIKHTLYLWHCSGGLIKGHLHVLRWILHLIKILFCLADTIATR